MASILSILGLVIILALQIFDAIDFAEHKPNTFINWLKSFPTLKHIVVSLETAMIKMSGLSVRARMGLRQDAIIEEKVNFLMGQIDFIQDGLDNLSEKLDKTDDKLNKRIDEMKAELKELNKSVDKKLAEHVIGSYDANIFGVIITICGIVIQVFRG